MMPMEIDGHDSSKWGLDRANNRIGRLERSYTDLSRRVMRLNAAHLMTLGVMEDLNEEVMQLRYAQMGYTEGEQ